MRTGGTTPRAVMILRAGTHSRILGTVDDALPCDLDLVNRLLSLHLAARRMGWTLHLVDTDAELTALLELVGVATTLGVPPVLRQRNDRL
jgi:hypothetical protein